MREEDGWALVTAIAVLAIAMALGLTSLSMLDVQQDQTRRDRVGESSFALAEGALGAQIHKLTQRWRSGGAAGEGPFVCGPGSTAVGCPSDAELRQLFANQDVDAKSAWTTSVHDNVKPSENFYDDASRNLNASWDQNGDKRLWVRAHATVRGRSRTLIALVRVDTVQEIMPRAALLSGKLHIDNRGNKVIVDGKVAEGATPSLVAVRCDPAADPNASCLAHPTNMNPDLRERLMETQISGTEPISSYAGGNALTPEAIERLRQTAITDGTYYETCPPEMPAGQVVWIVSGTCSYRSNNTVNSSTQPGLLLMESGTLSITGTLTYHGILYHVNRQNSSDSLITVKGNAQVIGGVIVDGSGGVEVGTSGGAAHPNVKVDERAHSSVRSYGNAGIIQNTWREIQPKG